ncbi:MAG: serine hydrolase domain-containing protein [Bacteroidota bacterium]
MKYRCFSFCLFLTSFAFAQGNMDHVIDSLLFDAIESEESPGLTLGVLKDGALIYHGSAGCMNLEYGLPFNDATVFELASVSKQFTSACIGVLASQGKLSVEDDVRKYIPELATYDGTIRIKHLLSHSSGIRNHNVLLDLTGFDYAHRGYTNEMIQKLMFRQKGVNNRPGAKMLYSNTNYVLLALIVERASGQKLYKFADSALFAPLGMTKTFFSNDLGAIVKNGAHPYLRGKLGYKQAKSLTLCVGAGGVNSTIGDLALWAQVFLDPRHPFAYLKDFITHREKLNDGELMSHARGMFVSPYKGYETYNHSGRGIGMRSQFICLPELKVGIIVYTNSEQINAVDISYKVLDLLIDEPRLSGEERLEGQPASVDVSKVVGSYQELNSDLRMTIFEENDTLKAISSFGRSANALKPKGGAKFCRLDNESVTYSFALSKTSESDLQVDFGGAIFYFERIQLNPNPSRDLTPFAGRYYSAELDVTYELEWLDGQLRLSYPNHNNIVLREGETDVFGANRRTKYSFARNKAGEVISFQVAAEGTVKDILFEKVR